MSDHLGVGTFHLGPPALDRCSSLVHAAPGVPPTHPHACLPVRLAARSSVHSLARLLGRPLAFRECKNNKRKPQKTLKEAGGRGGWARVGRTGGRDGGREEGWIGTSAVSGPWIDRRRMRVSCSHGGRGQERAAQSGDRELKGVVGGGGRGEGGRAGQGGRCHRFRFWGTADPPACVPARAPGRPVARSLPRSPARPPSTTRTKLEHHHRANSAVTRARLL